MAASARGSSGTAKFPRRRIANDAGDAPCVSPAFPSEFGPDMRLVDLQDESAQMRKAMARDLRAIAFCVAGLGIRTPDPEPARGNTVLQQEMGV